MPGPDVIPRRADRVLPIDPRNRVLLLCGFDPADPDHPFWFTVGGGADPGSLGRPVWRRVAEFAFDGRRYRQEEEYYALRVGSAEVSLAGMDESEKDTVTGYRWLSAPEFNALGEPFAPPELPRLLRDLTAPR